MERTDPAPAAISRQHEVSVPCPLHGADGRLHAEGWARHPHWRYRRADVPAPSWRVKEWDYYAVVSPDGWAIGVTTSNLGYAGLFALCFVDLARGHCWQVGATEWLPLARRALPEVVGEGEIRFASPRLQIACAAHAGSHRLRFASEHLPGGLAGELELTLPAGSESMSIATSWAENRRAFYHNTKLNCLRASGHIRFGAREIVLDPARDLGVLDWGRGVWTYDNTWYWSSASGYLDGVPFGFNLGYGFSDRTPASENLLLYAGVAHKLDQVRFEFDRTDWLKPWRFTSNDQRLELAFRPAVDRNSLANFGLIRSEQHQVFGYFSGTAVLDDGRVLKLADFPGFAEEVCNRW